MLEEQTVLSKDVTFVLDVLQDEVNSRIIHGDGDIEPILRVMEALENADRIVIR